MIDNCTATLDWEDLRCFAALARHGTLPTAARTLNATRRVVSRRLARLEARLGSALFVRKAGRLALTVTGVSVLAETAQMEMAACAVWQMCTGKFSKTVSGVRSRGDRSSPRAAKRERAKRERE